MRALYKTIFISLIFVCMYISTMSYAEEPVYVVRSTKQADIDPAFVKLLSEAKAAQKKANSVGGEWRDVGLFIQNAEKAAKEGKLEEATKLATKAKIQSELGYEQAVAQKGKVKLPSYLK